MGGARITVANVPAEDTPAEQLQAITAEVATGAQHDGVWRTHSSAAAPDWVESTDPELAQAISEHYGCPLGRPKAWEPTS